MEELSRVSDEDIEEALKTYSGLPQFEAKDFLMDALGFAPSLLGLPMPMMRYRGVKRSLATQLAKKMKKVKGIYHEPFVGSGSSLLRVGKAGRFKKAIISDLNPQITEYLKTLKKNPEGVNEAFLRFVSGLGEGIKGKVTKEDIPFMREVWNQLKKGTYRGEQKAGAHLFLGNYSRVYMPGEIPSFSGGRYRHSANISEKIRHLGSILKEKDVKIHMRGWQESLKDIKPGDFVTLDPPYLGTLSYPGISSTTAEDHARMSRMLERVSKETSGVVYDSPIGAKQFPWLEFEKTGLKGGEEVVGYWGKGVKIE